MTPVATLAVDCSGLDGFQAFSDYVGLIRNRTSFDETLLHQCQQAICQTLWGFGVDDLSGIGVAIGYVLSTVIGTLLPLLLLVLPLLPLGSRLRISLQDTATAGLESFFESAVYFALAIQIATCSILAPRDLEFMKSSVGVYEVRGAGLISTICILPLLSPIPILSSAIVSPPSTPARHAYRLSILSLAVSASLYTFVSQFLWYFAGTVIGDGMGPGGVTYVTDAEWQTLWHVCFDSGSEGGGGVRALSSTEFAALGTLHFVTFLYTMAACVVMVLQGTGSRYSGTWGLLQGGVDDCVDAVVRTLGKKLAEYLLVGVPFCLAAPLLWGFWRLRAIERQVSETATGYYKGNEWEFGQVMAITIFVPVGVEMWFVWVQSRREGIEEGDRQASGQENVGLTTLSRDNGRQTRYQAV